MKRIVVLAALFALLAASPVLACGEGKADSQMAWKQVKPQVEKLDDGVRLTFASADGAVIEKIANAARSGKILGCESQCPMKVKTIQRHVKVDSGRVILTATTTNAEMADYLQKEAQKMAKSDVTRSAAARS